MSSKPFSPERLMRIRRLRKARKLFRQMPLFAFNQMQKDYPDYALAEFWDDLRIRNRKKPKKHKSPLTRYGRYWRIEQLLSSYRETGDISLMVQAKSLRERIAKPYRVLVKLSGEYNEFSFSCLIPIEQIEQLNKRFKACKTPEEIEAVYQEFKDKTTRY